jgi:hypothetical protein
MSLIVWLLILLECMAWFEVFTKDVIRNINVAMGFYAVYKGVIQRSAV